MKTIFYHKCKVILCFFLFLILNLDNAHARNLSKRLGVGFTQQMAVSESRNLSAISSKYYLSSKFAASVAVGFDTRSDSSEVGVGAKLYRNVFFEDNMVFYLGGGLHLMSKDGSHLGLMAFAGSEFFIPGLPSLGFGFEAGLRGDSSRGNFSIRTSGDTFLNAGIHFYF